MKRALVLLLVAGVAGAASAASTPAADTLIRHGKGIGRIDLGMTEAQVRKRLGRPDAVLTEQLGFGRRYVELQYDGSFFNVGLLERGSGPRIVVSVATAYRSERTREGMGPGVLESRLLRIYGRRLRCERLPLFGDGVVWHFRRECVLGAGTGAETVFVTTLSPEGWSHGGKVSEWRAQAAVLDVVVRRGPLRADEA